MHRAHSKYAVEAESDEALIAKHGALIERAARRLAARTAGAVSADDLWSAGALGLIDAARRFDPSRDIRFETFAEHRIRGAMLDEMRRMDHLPRRLRTQAEEVERARTRLGHALKREPTSEELAAELKLSLDELDGLIGVTQAPLDVLSQLQTQDTPADQVVERAQIMAGLAKAITRLPDRLQLVLSLHYVEGLTYREIAKILDVSEPRICQIHSEAMGKLREILDGG
jgi:RNA polymerase sigma factor for flagellar operon FliA